MTSPTARRGLNLADLAALVVGYGLAALLARAFLPPPGSWTTAATCIVALLYAWLGLAMAGPVVLLVDRRARAEPGGSAHTWAEKAWLMIGVYWIVLTLLVVPTRMPVSPWLGIFPILAAIGLRFLSPLRPGLGGQTIRWTHHAAVGLLLAWPLAWGALILLGKTFS